MDETTLGATGDDQRTPGPAPRTAPEPAPAAAADLPGDPTGGTADGTSGPSSDPDRPAAKKRRRGSRGGKGRKKPGAGPGTDDAPDDTDDSSDDSSDAADGSDDTRDGAPGTPAPRARPRTSSRPDPAPAASAVSAVSPVPLAPDDHPELPERLREGRPSVAAAEAALVRKPQIGDTRPAPPVPPTAAPRPAGRGRGRSAGSGGAGHDPAAAAAAPSPAGGGDAAAKKRRRGGRGRGQGTGGAVTSARPAAVEVDPEVLEKRRGRERNGRPVGRYLMCVQVRPTLTQVAVLEGRNLIEHYVSRPSDDVSQIHGNIYLGKVQNVLPGMEAAFVDIGTPKNAVLYRGDVQYEAEDIVEKAGNLRIEQMLRAKQLIICQVTKNPIGAKGARLTQEVSLPGRFVVLIPNSKTYGISKRLPDDVRKRLRNILDRVKPAEHGLIVRTAAENATEHELRADMTRLLDQWNAIEAKAKRANSPTLLYREPELAVRVIREEFNAEYRGVVIDDRRLYDDVKDYVAAFNPELADRIEFHDQAADGLPVYERHHIHEQLHKALDRKVWLPSGGSLIIEHTEALTVIDVNTGKNVGTTNLEETVFRNNLEAAEEVAKQLRLRDIGGIVVIDFIDMEIRENRKKVVESFRNALARDKTRTQVFDISELGLVEMTRKRIGEGLLTNFADQCPNCEGRGVVVDHALLG
jgi:ribonuclease E